MIQDNLTISKKSSEQEIYADLHIHTNVSDGLLSPEKIAELCHNVGLHTIAITDHDAIDGIELARKGGVDIEVIPALEFSANQGTMDIHILAYLIDYKNGGLKEYLDDFCQYRMARIYKICKNLTQIDIKLDPEEIIKTAGSNALGRPHIARALLKYGYVNSIKEAFIKYLGGHCPYYVPKKEIHPKELIKMIRIWQGIAVIAHPGILNSDELILRLIEYGAQGIEVWHPEHRPSQIKKYYEMAKGHHLVMTGGSDFHSFLGIYNQIGQSGCSEKEIVALKSRWTSLYS